MPPPSFAVINPSLEGSTNGGTFGQGTAILKLALKTFTVLNASIVFEAFLYGVHCILFAICCFILARKRHMTSMIFLAAATVMFGLSTADFAFSLRLQLVDTPRLLQGQMSLAEVVERAVPKGQLFVANNLIADLLLLYRCSKAWNFRRWIIAISVLLLLGDTVWGWVGAGISKAYFMASWEKYTALFTWSIFCVNITMTLLIVCRIWWITKRARSHVTSKDLRLYRTTIIIFAETALIYSTCVLVTVVLPRNNTYLALAVVAAIRLVSIMPTLLIVQIAVGRSSDDWSKESTRENTEDQNLTQGAPAMLDTMIATQASAQENETQEGQSEKAKPNGAGGSA